MQFDGGPLRHQRREGDDTDGKADHRRVEGVLPEPAIKVFGDDDGEQGADDDQPPGSQRREGERQQPGGDGGAAVTEKHHQRFLLQAEHRCFGEQRGEGGDAELGQNRRAD